GLVDSAPVAVLEQGETGPVEVQELRLDALERGERQRRRTGIEVDGAHEAASFQSARRLRRRRGPRPGRGPRCPSHPNDAYIMPGIPPPGAAGAAFSGASATTASVVRMFFAIDAAFCSAERVTIAGSMIPALIRSTISPDSTLRPCPAFALRTSLTTTE